MTPAEELTFKTKAFWKLSWIWNGKAEPHVTTGEAIELCTMILQQTSNHRPLSYSAEALLEEIIKGEGNKAIHTKVIPFAKPIKKQKRGAKQ